MTKLPNRLENLNFQNTFAALGEAFYQIKSPDPAPEPYVAGFNPLAAELIDLDPSEASRPEFAEYFCGNRPLPGSRPLSMVYSGFQFGVYNPQLGDGRGILLGEVKNRREEKWDIHLKGAGATRFARGFDGRATLRSSIREYLGGEAMHGLGIPSTRSLAIVGIREMIYREKPELAAVLVRVCQSHIRFGSFEYFHYTNRPDKTAELADYVIHNHFPEIENEKDKYRQFFKQVVQKTACLIARWQSVGFAHGVMNTDNMSIVGLTFDYGPFGFMDIFNPNHVPNHSDTAGRYAYSRQPEIGHWNLSKLAQSLSGLLEPEAAGQDMAEYQPLYNSHYRELMAAKLGLRILDQDFKVLVGELFLALISNRVDYTNFFRELSNFPGSSGNLRKLFQDPSAIDRWLARYQDLLAREGLDENERKRSMDAVNPKYILRNYLAQRAIEKALSEADFSEIEKLRILLEDPFSDRPELFARHNIDPDYYASDTPQSFVGMQVSCSA